MNIRINRKTQFAAILYAINEAKQIDESMTEGVTGDDLSEMIERIGSLLAAVLVITSFQKQYSDMQYGKEIWIQVSDHVYNAIQYAVNVVCDIYSDTFEPHDDPSARTVERVDLLIDLNRLDVQLN